MVLLFGTKHVMTLHSNEQAYLLPLQAMMTSTDRYAYSCACSAADLELRLLLQFSCKMAKFRGGLLS